MVNLNKTSILRNKVLFIKRPGTFYCYQAFIFLHFSNVGIQESTSNSTNNTKHRQKKIKCTILGFNVK